MLYQTVLVRMHELSMLLCKHCPSAFYGVAYTIIIMIDSLYNAHGGYCMDYTSTSVQVTLRPALCCMLVLHTCVVYKLSKYF